MAVITIARPTPRIRQAANAIWLRMLRVPDAATLQRWTDMELGELLNRRGHRQAVYTVVLAEFDRRARRDRVARQRRERARAARLEYDLMVHAQFLRAEDYTRGNLLNRAGEHAGIDPISLFSGPEWRVRKWASEELAEWFEMSPANRRVTFAEWKRQSREQQPE